MSPRFSFKYVGAAGTFTDVSGQNQRGGEVGEPLQPLSSACGGETDGH